MSTKLIAGVAIVFGCVAAAAGGAYFALRQNANDLTPTQTSALVAAPAPGTEGPVAPAQAEPAKPAVQPETAAPAESPARPVYTSRPVSQPARPNGESPRSADSSARPTQESAAAVPPAPTESSSGSTAPVKTDPIPATTESAPVAMPAATPQDLPKAQYRDVTVAADSVIGIRLDSTLSTETAKVEDAVNARVSRDVLVDGRTAIAAGARLEGFVTEVERGGKFKDRPRLGIRFTSLVLADGTRTAIQTETIYREGESPTSQSVAKVGGSAVVGAILGGLLGGKKGAVAGTAVGAAGGAAAVAKGDRPETVLTSGLMLTVRLTAPVTVTIERDHD
jgi:hypothetical protein